MTTPTFVAVSTNLRFLDIPQHMCPESYTRALRDVSGVAPLLLPGMDIACVLPLLDKVAGIVLTGGPSHIESHHYGHDTQFHGCDVDPARDAMALALVREAHARKLPLLGICRGMQEMNVAMGGTLQHNVQEIAGRRDHRSDAALATHGERLSKVAHPLHVAPGGVFERWFGKSDLGVNSLHEQGIDAPAPSLFVEGHADDGTIEAISDPAHPFFVGVQWHPEWTAVTDPVGRKLFEEFGAAVRAFAAGR